MLSTATGIGYARFVISESGPFDVVDKLLGALCTNFCKSKCCGNDSGWKEGGRGTSGGGVAGAGVVREAGVELGAFFRRRGTMPSGAAFCSARNVSSRRARSLGSTGSLC